MAGEMTLLEFLRLHIASADEWAEYEQVMYEKLPHGVWEFFHFEEAVALSLAPVRRKVALEEEFTDRLVREMQTGRWSATARWITGGPFVDLHRRDWEIGRVDFVRSVLGRLNGGYGNIRIRWVDTGKARSGPSPEKKRVRSAVGSWIGSVPKAGSQVTFKEALQWCRKDLAPQFHPQEITTHLFRRQWPSFPEERKWRGPPTKD